MSEVRVKINQVVENQLPRFVREEFPLVGEFLKQYYRSFEFQSGASDLLQSIDQYIKIDQLANLTETTTLSSNVSFADDTISVDSTYGFPDSYGLIKIDDEIITYTSKTSTQFKGCIRGFSAITSYDDPSTTDQLIFSDSEIAEHTLESVVTNLSVLFLKEFFNKVKKQVSPGFENRELYSGLNESLFVKQSKDFYSSKGTDASFKILFGALYGKDVEVVRPRDYLIQPSDAQYRITKDLVVEAIDGDPMDLQNKTLYQDYSDFTKKAEGTISKVERIVRGEKEYYVLSLDYDYDKDVNVSGTVLGEFTVHPTTQTVTNTSTGSTTLDVDSTVGFPSSGNLIIDLENGTSLTVTYEEKSLNQFYGCSGINQTFSSGQNVRIDDYAYGYSGITTANVVKVRVSGVLSNLDILNKTILYQKDDLIKIKSLGADLTDYRSNNWFYNISTRYDVKTIQLLDLSDYTYRVYLYDNHNFSVGDSVTLISSDSQEFNSNVVFFQNKTSFDISGQGLLNTAKFYSVRKNILKANFQNYPDITKYTANIQNVYTDLNESLYVASPSLPNYPGQPINIIDRSIVFSGTFSGTELNIGPHNLYTGDTIVYNPESITNKLNLSKGIYFVKKVDNNIIKLARSKENIFTDNFISISGTVTNNKFYLYKFSDDNLNLNLIENQKLIRKISSPENTNNTYETVPGTTGIFVNGVEVLNYKSDDLIYYGEIENINVLSGGTDYDVINPPILTISDNIGTGAEGYCSVIGNLKRIEIIEPGFDYLENPSITVSGGNGSGAIVQPNLIEFDHFVEFNSISSAGHVNLTNNTVGFSSYHKFRNAEKVIYNTQGGTSVGGLVDGSFYHVAIQDAFTIKLHKNLDDAVVGINTIDMTSYGSGVHKFSSIVKKKKLGSVTVVSPGSGYQNKKVTTTSIGINTSSNLITIKNHGFKSGELISYQTTGSVVGGLSTTLNYYVTTISDNQFKLSKDGFGNIGIGTQISNFYYETKQYINLTSTGSGTHIFNYPEIALNITDSIGVSTLSGQNFSAVLQPIFRGSIDSIFVESGGESYGSEEILNYNKQPSFSLTNGSGAQVIPIILNGKIAEVLVVNSGSGYNSPPNLSIIGTGSGALLTPVISGGFLSEVKVISGGSGYSSSTFINVISAGSESKFEAQIKSWRVNLVERLLNSNQISSDDGIITESINENFGLKYSHAYAPRKLRTLSLATKFIKGKATFISDLQSLSGIEVLSDAHSPIIGWAYDGNPIYGPYGYSSPEGGVVKCLKSGYSLSINSNRPSTSLYPNGFFVEDYEFTGSGDLDKYNGRFCVTPEYPNGIYAYFCTINGITVDSSGIFANYRRPLFPYVIGNQYKSKPISFNFEKSSNQDQIDINETGWLRNTNPYNMTNKRSYYDYIIDPNKIKKQLSVVKGTTKGSINSIGIETGGDNYQVNDVITFNNTGTNGFGLNAQIDFVGGKQISQVSTAISTYDVEFVPAPNRKYFIGFTTQPHVLKNKDIVTISSSLDYQKNGNITVTTNQLILTSGIGTTGSTGHVTYLQVNGALNYPDIRENDVYQLANEQIKILNIDKVSSRVRVLRNINNKAGLSTYSAGIALTEVTRKLQLNFGISTSYQYIYNKEFYFDPSESVGLGTTSGPGIGYTLSFTNPGVGITQINIPTRSIYLPNHQLNTGTELIYSSNGGTPISISTNGISSFQIPENSTVYVAKISDDLIGISTIKVGLGTTGSFVGIGSTVSGIAYFTNVGLGNTHSFTTNYANTLKTQVNRNQITVSTASTHGLQTNDEIYLQAKPGLTTTVTLKYDDYNRRLVINPKSFVNADVDIVDDSITIQNHGYITGEKIIHTSTSPSGGLSNESIYYAIVVDENKIKLAETYHNATQPIPIAVGISTSSLGTLSQINPQIKLVRNYNLTFDVSDSSLSFFNNNVQYSAFDFNFYTDPEFKNIFNSTTSSSSFEVVKSGSIGITPTAKVTLKVNDNVPNTLYYSLNPINLNINSQVKKEIVIDGELINHNQIVLIDSVYSGKHNINRLSDTKFTYTIVPKLETSQYTLNDGSFEYYTNSTTAFGKINSISITSKGANYKKVPKIENIRSGFGTGAILIPESSGIGSITSIEINDIGFDYPSDLSLRPLAKLPEIIKVESLSSFKSIKISSVGKNYTVAPTLVVVDSVTNKVISDVDLTYKIGDSNVTILKNTKGISNVSPIIIPTNNVNGVGISTITFIESTKDVVVTLGASFSNAADFPFNIGDKVLIESISVGTATTLKGYNSKNYDYALFTIVNTDPNIGGIGATVSYNIEEYLKTNEIPGTYDPVRSYGRIIPQKHFPTFDIELQKNEFFNAENVYSETASGSVISWESGSSYLKVSTDLGFLPNQIIFGESSKCQAKILEIVKFDSVYDVSSSSIVKKGWNRETGFLNNNFQRIHDNDYYQYFSYALKSEISLDTWGDTVNDLNHSSGFKKFSDLIIESSPEFSGISTNQNNGDLIAITDINSTINTNCVFDFDLVKENNVYLNNRINSNEIIFNSKPISDYIESRGNRVLILDDISSQFNSNPRETTYSVVDGFSIDQNDPENAYRFRKYIALVTDTYNYTNQQISIVSLLHDNANGFINHYGRVESMQDLGTYDFLITGTQGNLLFYPTNPAASNYDVSLASYSLRDITSGVGTVFLGDSVVIETFTQNIPIATSTATTIVGISSVYRASKLLIQIEASDKSYFEVDEVTVIHDGTSADILEYGQITTDSLSPTSSSGIGTFSASFSGSNLNISLTPNSGLSTDYNINTFAVSIGNTSTTTTGTQTISDLSLSSTITSITSSSSPIANEVCEFSYDYYGAYYVAVIEDKTNNQYQVSELVSLSNDDGTFLTEFGVIQTGSSIGSFTIDNPLNTKLYFTPIPNADVEVRIYQHAITNSHDSTLLPSIDFINGIIESDFGSYTGSSFDIKKSFNLSYRTKPIFERRFRGNNSNIVNLTANKIRIPGHFFVTGEKVFYSNSGAGTTQAIGIATTSIPGIGVTDKLPSTLYIVKSSDIDVKVAASASEALSLPPSVLTLSNVGVGASHTFRSINQNSKVLISIDNIIQSPIVSTAVTSTLVENVQIIDSSIKISGITSFFSGDIIKVNNELMRLTAVGFGSTNVLLVDRQWMGTGISTHSSGNLVTKILGNFNIVNNLINFTEAPFGRVPFPNPSTRPDEQDYIGIETSSKFNGRVFLKSGTPNTTQESYYNNYIFDNMSGDFDALNKDFILKSNSQNVTGVSTSNAIILINSIFQQPSRLGDVNVIGDYSLSEGSGITTISFTGAASSVMYDINTATIPRGGVIVSVGSTSGFGYQPLVSAGGTAIVSAAGTIASISIGNSGSGYRVGIQTVVNVGVQTSSVGTPNIQFIGTAAISGGHIVSVAITNPGVGYTSSNPPIVVFDDPLSYSNIPLVYSSVSPIGIGTEATVDIIVGQGSSVINFEIKNIGHSYGEGETLTVEIGGATGIPTNTSLPFKEFQLFVDRTFSDIFSGWSIGDLQVLDPIDSLFDGERKDFPLSINGEATSIRSKKGSNIDIKATLLIFINDILQVPGVSYTFDGGSVITFSEPPKPESKSKILFYKGNSEVDIRFIDIIEPVKDGDNLTIYSENINLSQDERLVTKIKSSNIANTNLYDGPGISQNTDLLRSVTLCRQTEDKIINEQQVGKNRTMYEPLIQPTTNIIQNIGISSGEIFVESVKTFFDNASEYDSSEEQPKTIIITSQDTIVAAAATAVVSIAGTISSIVINDGGFGYVSAPSVTIQNPVGLGTTQRAEAISAITSGIVTTITVTNPGTGYTYTNPPSVLIEIPASKKEFISKVNYSGDFGVITGIKTTSVGVASTGLVLDLFVPPNSFLRNISVNNVGLATTGVSGIQTGYYFVVFNSNVGSAVTSLRQDGTVVGYGTQFIDNIYQASAVSIAQTSVPGIGVTYVTKVTVNLQSYNGITGIGFSNFYGEFSWGRITNLTRPDPQSFTIYNNGLSGISTSPVVQRVQPLKYRNYST